MSVTDKKIGEKIKELRLKKRMTQKDLSGDQITRNMLSLIENGMATPSVATLVHIASRLDVPVGYFFSASEEEEIKYLKMSVAGKVKSLYAEKNYSACVDIASSLPCGVCDDEIAMIAGISYLKLSEKYAKVSDMKKAREALKKAEEYSVLSIYLGSDFTSAVTYFKTLFDNLCSDAIPDVLSDISVCGELLPREIPEFFTGCSFAQQGKKATLKFLSVPARRFIDALLLISENKLSESFLLLKEILDAPLPYYMQYRAMSALEETANSLSDFKSAYTFAKKKLELIDILKK